MIAADDVIPMILTKGEILVADTIAAARMGYAEAHGYKNKARVDVDDEAAHVVGIRGELVSARYLNRYWHPVIDNLNVRYDVGGYQIRTRRTGGQIDLTFKIGEDNPDDIFIACAASPKSKVTILGWAYGRECLDGERHERGVLKLAFKPYKTLSPMSTLPPR